MHPQLAAVVQEFRDAQSRLLSLKRTVPEERWHTRPAQGRWSVAECVAHLNLTSEAYLPLLDAALEEAREAAQSGREAPERYRRDLVGWILWKSMGPPVRSRMKTKPRFDPDAAAGPDELVAEFGRLQEAQIERVGECEGLPLHRVRMSSPFAPRVRYSLYSCLTILPAHQHRHLWQAEEAWRALQLETPAGG